MDLRVKYEMNQSINQMRLIWSVSGKNFLCSRNELYTHILYIYMYAYVYTYIHI